jgi:PAS domain-containing protein
MNFAEWEDALRFAVESFGAVGVAALIAWVSWLWLRKREKPRQQPATPGMASDEPKTDQATPEIYRLSIDRIKELERRCDECDLENQVLRQRIVGIERKAAEDVAKMREQYSVLAMSLNMLTAANEESPFPMWLKDREQRIVWLSPSYEKLILAPIGRKAADQIGRTDIENWGEKLGAIYHEADRQVFLTERAYDGVEPVVTKGGEIPMRIIKYPVKHAGVVIATAGTVVIPREHMRLFFDLDPFDNDSFPLPRFNNGHS